MPTTPKGLRYPAATARPDVPLDIGNLATDVDGIIRRTHAGRSNVSFAGTSSERLDVVLPAEWQGRTFGVQALGVHTSGLYFASLTVKDTAAGTFSVRLTHYQATNATTTGSIEWRVYEL